MERVIGRLTWGRVLRSAALSGVWFGLLIGVVLGRFPPGGMRGSVFTELLAGAGADIVFAAMGYAALGGRRTFASRAQVVADRYEVLSEPRSAERVRDLPARLPTFGTLGGPGTATGPGTVRVHGRPSPQST